jgi:hypothetical protein
LPWPIGFAGIDCEVSRWDNPTVDIVKTDSKNRVVLHGAGPQRAFQVVRPGEDVWILTRWAPPPEKPSRITIRKVDGFTVASCGRKITQAEVRKLLDEFP